MKMTILELLVLLLIAAACGGIAQVIAGYSRGGLFVAIVLGFVGAMLGMWLARKLNLPEPFVVQVGDATFPVIWSIVGGTLFVAVISMMTRRRYYR
jgi:uncharacterized membrane protein YeaQ/YmgE (transglycosylase-associated protein family)